MAVKFTVSLGIGIVFALLVYFGLIDSLTRSSVNFQAIPNSTAISIVLKENNLSKDEVTYIQSKFVYLKSNGNLYLSDEKTKKIGNFIGITSPTVTTGNHFAWEIKLTQINQTYYVDHVSGEIISNK
ncbi:MAG TPA: hypothetical protein VJ767_01140 [Nitrososphaeraceae archaeon]|nr:hypothetical protein [Nitrososphaeraceae archaeon]